MVGMCVCCVVRKRNGGGENAVGCNNKNEMKKCYQHEEREKRKKQMQHNMKRKRGERVYAEYLQNEFETSVRPYLYASAYWL